MKNSSEKGNVFAVIATTVAILSLAVNIYFYLDTSSINEVLAVQETCEKDCEKEKLSLSRDFNQQLELRSNIERSLEKQNGQLARDVDELDEEVKALEKRAEDLFAKNMVYRGENIGLITTVDQLKQILAAQGKMEKYIEENLNLKAKLAELKTLIKLKDGNFDNLKEKWAIVKKDNSAYKKELAGIKSALNNERRTTAQLKSEGSLLRDSYQKLANSHTNLKANIVLDLERFYDVVEDAMSAKIGKRKSANNRVRTKFNNSLMPRYQKQKEKEVYNASLTYYSEF